MESMFAERSMNQATIGDVVHPMTGSTLRTTAKPIEEFGSVAGDRKAA